MTNKPKEYVPKALRLGDPPKWRGPKVTVYTVGVPSKDDVPAQVYGPVKSLEEALEFVPPCKGACVYQFDPGPSPPAQVLYEWDGGKWVLAPGKE